MANSAADEQGRLSIFHLKYKMKYPIKIVCALISLTYGSMSFGNDDAKSNSLSVPFEFGSTTFDPNPFATEMLKLAPYSAMVIINGRTSNMTYSKRDEQIALKRAISARNYLIDIGVSPLKILINYASAADYIVDNTSLTGKGINQRVDIQLIQVDPRVLGSVEAPNPASVWSDTASLIDEEASTIEPVDHSVTVDEIEKPAVEADNQTWIPVVPADGWQEVR